MRINYTGTLEEIHDDVKYANGCGDFRICNETAYDAGSGWRTEAEEQQMVMEAAAAAEAVADAS